MKLSFAFLIIVLTSLGVLGSTPTIASSFWIEGDILGGLNSKVFFGEYRESQPESSPGELDSIVPPTVTVFDADGTEKTVTAELSTNHFVVPSGKTILVQALEQPVYEKQEGKNSDLSISVKPYFYARLGNEGSLPLDIKQNGNKLQLSFRDKPLAEAELVIIDPNGWEKHLRTDEKGEAMFSLPGLGLYVVEAEHEYKQSGEFDGKPYDREKHTVTFSIYQ